MNKFNQTLTEALETLLAKEGVGSAVSQLKRAREAYEKENSKIEDLRNEINSRLAVEMKKILSDMGMKVAKYWSFIIRDGITFKYRSRSISLNPNFENSTWEISPGSESVGDIKFYKRVKDLDGCDLSNWRELLTGIAEEFRENYKSLQGDDFIANRQQQLQQQEIGEEDVE